MITGVGYLVAGIGGARYTIVAVWRRTGLATAIDALLGTITEEPIITVAMGGTLWLYGSQTVFDHSIPNARGERSSEFAS